MNKYPVRNSVLALLGLASLWVYVLACTSFSPDDSKILYPTIDAKTGTIGVAVYDRKSRKSDLLFSPSSQDIEKGTNQPVIVRSQWFGDGHSILVAWPFTDASGNGSQAGLTFAVLPFKRPGPTRLFMVPGLKDGAASLLFPLPLAGTSVFLTGESNSVLRLDLETGQMRCEAGPPGLTLLPTPSGERLFYVTRTNTINGAVECGVFNPDTFVRQPLFQLESSKLDKDGACFAFSRDAKRFAYCSGEKSLRVAHIVEAGKAEKSLPIGCSGAGLMLGNLQFSPMGDILYASFMDPGPGRTNASFGFIEIPVNGGPEKQTTLITGAGNWDEGSSLNFQFDVSHDGKTLAVASTYLAYAPPLKANDCALFLVNLAVSPHKVTKVPIPLPFVARSGSR